MRDLDDITGGIVDASLRIHRDLGPGLLESVYEAVLARALDQQRLAPVHSKQLLTYLKLTNTPVGPLINFGAATLREGLHRIVNGLPASASPRLRVSAVSASPRLRVNQGARL
jgi:hypothetical protein